MRKFSITLIAIALFVVLGFSAFAAEKKTVEFWSYVPLDNPGLYLYIDKFNQSQDEINIEGKFIPFAEFKRQLTVALVGGTPPDCVLVDNPDFAAYIAMGAFEALDDKIADWEYGMISTMDHGRPQHGKESSTAFLLKPTH